MDQKQLLADTYRQAAYMLRLHVNDLSDAELLARPAEKANPAAWHLGHLSAGTVGMEGAFEAMGTGEVDGNWAKEHHSLWLEEELGRSRAAPKGAAATTAE